MMSEEAPDEQVDLLRRAVEGDARAAQDLTGLLGGRAFAQAFRMLGNRAEAEDVTQDAMMRLWRIAPTWDEGRAKPSTWLYRVVANLCIDRLRRNTPMSLDADDAPDPRDPTPGVEARLQTQSRVRALHDALRQLPDRQQQAMVLRHIEGWSNPDIADAMGISVEAVESLTARAKRALAQALAGQREELGFEYDET